MRGFYDDFHDKGDHHDTTTDFVPPPHDISSHLKRDDMDAIDRIHHDRGLGRADH